MAGDEMSATEPETSGRRMAPSSIAPWWQQKLRPGRRLTGAHGTHHRHVPHSSAQVYPSLRATLHTLGDAQPRRDYRYPPAASCRHQGSLAHAHQGLAGRPFVVLPLARVLPSQGVFLGRYRSS